MLNKGGSPLTRKGAGNGRIKLVFMRRPEGRFMRAVCVLCPSVSLVVSRRAPLFNLQLGAVMCTLARAVATPGPSFLPTYVVIEDSPKPPRSHTTLAKGALLWSLARKIYRMELLVFGFLANC